MTNIDTVIRHITQGQTYSWDLTMLMGLGLPVSPDLRAKLLNSRTTPDEAALVTSLYLGQQFRHTQP